MTAATLHPEARQGLGALARVLSKLDDVQDVLLSQIQPRRFIMFVIVSQELLDARRVSQPPQDLPLALTLWYVGYTGTEADFMAEVDDREATSLLRIGYVQIWPFAAVIPSVATLVYDASTGRFVPREPTVQQRETPQRVGNTWAIGGVFETDRPEGFFPA